MSEGIQTKLQTIVNVWDEKLSYIEEGGDVTYAFLELCKNDLSVALDGIRCDYCKKQMEVEHKLISHALELAKMANEWTYAEGISQKVKIILKALLEILKIALLQLSKAF